MFWKLFVDFRNNFCNSQALNFFWKHFDADQKNFRIFFVKAWRKKFYFFQSLVEIVLIEIKTITHCEASPPQGLSEARRGNAVSSKIFPVIDPPRGRPFGGGEGIANFKSIKNWNKIQIILSSYFFNRKPDAIHKKITNRKIRETNWWWI